MDTATQTKNHTAELLLMLGMLIAVLLVGYILAQVALHDGPLLPTVTVGSAWAWLMSVSLWKVWAFVAVVGVLGNARR